MLIKVCAVCNVTKPMEYFAKDRKAKDGHDSRCLGCKRARQKLQRAAARQAKKAVI